MNLIAAPDLISTPSLTVAVAIIGAGPVGATLAAALAARGVPVAVVDAAPLPPMELAGFDGRAYAIALASKRLLEQAGIWERLPGAPCPIEGIKVADGRVGEAPSSLDLDFEASEVADEPFGWMVEARALRVALPHATFTELPTAGHMLPWEATDVVVDEVRELLVDLEARRATA